MTQDYTDYERLRRRIKTFVRLITLYVHNGSELIGIRLPGPNRNAPQRRPTRA
jgi:hypothetical protein